MKNLLFFGPYPPPFGGISSHLHDLLPALAVAGYRSLCLTPGREPSTRHFPWGKHIVVDMRRQSISNPVRSVAAYARSLSARRDLSHATLFRAANTAAVTQRVVREHAIDAIFVYELMPGHFIPILRSVFDVRLPVGLMLFGELYSNPQPYVSASAYVRSIVDGCDGLLSSSQHCANSVASVLGLDHRVKVIFVGVDEIAYSPKISGEALRAELHIPHEAVAFLYLARMHQQLGLDVVLGIALEFLEAAPTAYLVIAGAQGDMSADALVLANAHPRIRFRAEVPTARKPEFYAASDVLLAPSKETHPCMGVSIKEAMASGRPVIATRAGGIPEAIEDGVQGYLVPLTGGRADGRVLFERAMRLYLDGQLRARMGSAGRQKAVALFTNQQTTAKYLEVLRNWSSHGVGESAARMHIPI